MIKPSLKHLYMDEMEQNNKKWFDEFRAKTHHDSKGYYQTIENFLRYSKFKDKTLPSFTKADVDDYIHAMWEGGCSTGRTDDVIATISSFKNFLIENCSFKQDFLHDIRSLQVNEEGTPDSTPLTLRQLHHIREYNKRDIIDEYIFELFFQLGIDKKDLSICVPQNADYETHFFRYKNKAIRYNERISQILAVIKNATLYDLTTKMQNIDYHYFEKVTIHLIKNIPGMWEKERPLRYSDILKSHKIYMLKCPNPNCEELSENFQQNWVLLKAEPDTEYRLVCSRCKGKPYEC